MFETGCDFTNGFRRLSIIQLPGVEGFEESKERFLTSITKECASLEEMRNSYKPKIDPKFVEYSYQLLFKCVFLFSLVGCLLT